MSSALPNTIRKHRFHLDKSGDGFRTQKCGNGVGQGRPDAGASVPGRGVSLRAIAAVARL